MDRVARSIDLVALDLDGTLLDDSGRVSPRSLRALRSARDCGIRIVIVTGRSPLMVLHELADVLGREGTVICANGAAALDIASGSLLWERLIPPAAGLTIVTRLRAAWPDACFAVDRGLSFACEPQWTVRNTMTAHVARRDRGEALVSEPVSKVLMRVDDVHPDELAAASEAVLHELATVTTSTSWGLLEISANGVDKGSALARWAGELGVPADRVAAVGDMPNDLSMLRWAGLAVAVANGHPEVISLADWVTESNDADGVALVLESLVSGEPLTRA